MYTGFINRTKTSPGAEHEELVDEATWNLVQSNLHHDGIRALGRNKELRARVLTSVDAAERSRRVQIEVEQDDRAKHLLRLNCDLAHHSADKRSS